MSKKRLYIIVAITAIITFGFFLAAYIISQQGNTDTETPKNSFANFFPFGKGGQTDGGKSASPSENNQSVSGGGNTGVPENNSLAGKKNILALRQISDAATAGYSPSLLLGKTAVRFVERATGNIFETAMEDMRKDRISNALIPRTQEALFGNSGKFLVYRYIKEGGSSIVSFVRNVPNPDKSVVANANSKTTTNPIDGTFLMEDIPNVFVSSDTKNMFYLTKTSDFQQDFQTRQAAGSVFNFEKNTSLKVFQSPFTGWLPVYFDGKTVLLQTKASQNVPGFLYSVSTPNWELQKIIGGIKGLTALPSPDAQKILYSESNRGGLVLNIYDRKEKKTLTLSLQTLPEKCVWGADGAVVYCAAPDYIPSAEYPDAWYQGSVSFSDTVWKIDPKTGTMSALFFPESFVLQRMDMQNLALSPNKDFLFFINKIDSTLWGYDLKH